jgi:hypothetical protein
MEKEMFGGIPNPKPALDLKRAAWIGLILLVVVGGLSLAQSLATPRAIPWSVTGGKLQIHARVWNDDFPLRDLQLDQSRILDLTRETGWRPREKSWGVNGFGLNAGRFKLQNGESVYLYLAKETTAVLIPRRGDVPVMVGVQDPQAFLAALRDAAQ